MDAVVKEEEDSVNDERNMIEPKKEVEETVELKEPKVELIEEQDVKMEELDEEEYKHMIPYEYRDYIEQHEKNEQENSRKRRAEQQTPFKKKAVECQVCRKMIILDCFKTALNHAGIHTNFIRYECPVEGCDYKCWPHQTVTGHMRSAHKMFKPTLKDVVRIELSDEEKVEVRNMVNNCFPEVTQTSRKRNSPSLYTFNCLMCNSVISESSANATAKRRNHAFTHTDIMLYECIKPECNFKTKYFESFRKHQMFKHGKIAEMISNVKRKLPSEKVFKIEEMVKQCFPGLKELEAEIAQFKEEQSKKRCYVCYKTLHINDLESKDFRRFHALSHTDIMIYKCCKQDCHFKALNRSTITNHQKWMHCMNMNDMPVIQIELTNEQEIKIEKMMVQCFPEWKDE